MTARRRRPVRLGDRDDGLATVLAAVAVAVIVALLGLGVAVSGAVLARHRAESAADLAALAGASDAAGGTGPACGRAAEVARTNGAVLTSCTWRGWAVSVVVSRPCTCLPSVVGAAVGRARAGPVAVGGTPSGGSW